MSKIKKYENKYSNKNKDKKGKIKKLINTNNIILVSLVVLLIIVLGCLVYMTFEDSENTAKKPEKIVLDVFNEDAVNIYQESFKYDTDDYNISIGFGSKLYISTDNFDLSSSNSSLIKYDNRLKNYVKEYENIISSDTGSTNEKSKLIYKDILEKQGKKDVLIVTNNKGYIIGVFIAENSIGYDWNTYIIDNYYLDVYNAGSVIYNEDNK